jgi:hypothetical protein
MPTVRADNKVHLNTRLIATAIAKRRANRREDEEKERAARLPRPPGVDDAARQDA